MTRVTTSPDSELTVIECPNCEVGRVKILRSPRGFEETHLSVECQECQAFIRTYRNGNITKVITLEEREDD